MRIVKLCGRNYREFDVGEKVWIVYHTLVVRCTITKVDDCFRKRHPDAYLFYDVDEPIGHSLGEDELFTSRRAAMSALESIFADWQTGKHGIDKWTAISVINRFHTDTLESVRRGTAEFIVATHHRGKSYGKKNTAFVRRHVPELLATYPPKVEGVDWFRVMWMQPRDPQEAQMSLVVHDLDGRDVRVGMLLGQIPYAVYINNVELPMEEFLKVAQYVLRTTDLVGKDDARLAFVDCVSKLKPVPGWNKGGKRLDAKRRK